MAKLKTLMDAHLTSALTLNQALDELHPRPRTDDYSRMAQTGCLRPIQIRAILAHAADELPCSIKIEQRTPYGVAYVQAGAKVFDVSSYGKYLGEPSDNA